MDSSAPTEPSQARVVGRVVDSDGFPAQCRVVAVHDDHSEFWGAFRETLSGSDGCFVFDDIDDGRWGLYAEITGLASPLVVVKVGAESEPEPLEIEITMSRGKPIGGRVVDADGEGLGPGYRVALHPGMGIGNPHPHAHRLRLEPALTGDDGRFVFEGVVDGVYSLEFGGRDDPIGGPGPYDHGSARVTATAGQMQVVLRVPRPGRVEGRVEFQGEPPKRYEVQVNGATTSASGSTFVVEGVAPGTCHVKVRADGYEEAYAKKMLSEGGEAEVALRLRPTTTAVGLVIGADGRPVAGAYVALQPYDGQGTSGLVQAFTGADGRFALPGVVARTVVVSASASGHGYGYAGPVEPGRDAPDAIEVALSPAAVVRGRVRNGRRPTLRAFIMLRSVDLPEELRDRLPLLPLVTHAAPDGRFHVPDLRPGAYVVSITTSASSERLVERSLDLPLEVTAAGKDGWDIYLTEGPGRLVLDLSRLARIRWRILLSSTPNDAAPLGPDRVPHTWRTVADASEPSVAFEGLAPGDYHLWIDDERAIAKAGLDCQAYQQAMRETVVFDDTLAIADAEVRLLLENGDDTQTH